MSPTSRQPARRSPVRPAGSPPTQSSVLSPQASRRAVALRYDPAGMAAPEVVAGGRGDIAERIIALAEQHGIPVKHDPDLVAVLATLDVGSAIPPELYQAVAEVLAFVYRLNAAQTSRQSPVASRQ